MEVSHYGVLVNSEKPVVGVVTNHEPEYLSEELFGEGAIDIDWLDYRATCESEEDAEDEAWEQGTTIIGFVESPMDAKVVIKTNPMAIAAGGKVFVPDPNAEYQAIVGQVYTQVLWSRYVQRCPLCSPCYPGQGDLDTEVPGEFEHEGFLAYTLPPDVWGDRKDWRRISRYCVTRGEVAYA